MTGIGKTYQGPDGGADILDFLPVPVLVQERSGRVAYCNAAFEKIFGWSLDEIMGQPLDFIPPSQQKTTQKIFLTLDWQKTLHGFRTWRWTKSGERVDVVMDAMQIGGRGRRPGAVMLTFNNITRQLRLARGLHLLLRIADTPGRYDPARRLDYMTRLIRAMMKVEITAFLLPDEAAGDLFVALCSCADHGMAVRMKGLRFSVNQSGVGAVYRTGRALIADETDGSRPFAETRVPWPPGMRNMLVAALPEEKQVAGLLALINKRNCRFDDDDRDVLNAVAVMAAPTVRETFAGAGKMLERFHLAGCSSESLVQYLSHELKTPLAVLSACISLLERGETATGDPKRQAIRERIERNLQRLLDVEYALEDILTRWFATGDWNG